MRRLIFLLTFLVFCIEPVYACSCVERPFEEAVESADEIFIGRVVKIEEKKEFFSSDFREYWVSHFDVSKKWKGNKRTKIRVIQSYNSCEFSFEFGREYLVYAMETNQIGWNGTREHTTWLCSRTIDTMYYSDLINEDWIWDDRELLNTEFPAPVQISSIYNNWPIWVTILFLIIGISSWKLLNRKRNAL